MPTWIYHITHICNLSSIFQTGRLIANRRLQSQQIPYSDIFYERIQDRRARTPVPCGAGGMLHHYIPFYFGPRSPMLYTINRGNVPGCTEGQTPILYLITTAEKIVNQGLSFVFTDGHAVIAYTSFYDSLDDLDNVDFDLMQSTLWTDTLDDGDRKRRRQAECLVYQFLPWHLINGIAVINADMQQQVQAILQEMNHDKRVEVRRHWYSGCHSG